MSGGNEFVSLLLFNFRYTAFVKVDNSEGTLFPIKLLLKSILVSPIRVDSCEGIDPNNKK